MAISGKVSAGTVGAAAATLVSDTIARHIGHPVPADIMALVGAALTAGVTFVCGYVARHVPVTVVKDTAELASTMVADVAETAAEEAGHNLMTGA